MTEFRPNLAIFMRRLLNFEAKRPRFLRVAQKQRPPRDIGRDCPQIGSAGGRAAPGAQSDGPDGQRGRRPFVAVWASQSES